MIHVCFSLYDPARHYSKFTGTAMLSLFENHTPPHLPSITVHLLHDNTLTQDNRDKLIQIAERYGQQLKFYNVEELCTDRFEQMILYFPDVYADRHSIAMFYRFFIPELLLPQGIEKAIYLDSDIVVNLDIAELWQIELDDKPFGAIPEINQFSNKDVGIKTKKGYIAILSEGVVNPEDYLNSGVLLMNLKVLREEEANLLEGIKFISEHPQFEFLDQDILNYCFSTSYLKLPTKFNRFVLNARRENELLIDKKIYHFAASRLSFIMNSRDPFNQTFMNYFTKTPWVDADTAVALSGGHPSRKSYPISVVIPLYNMQEYIGECLDSLLIQTFQAFEVIVVDDCSTDNSVAIVKRYLPKFGGRLKLTKTKKNSGGGGYIPRNIGLKLTRGEYVYFLDADDMILSTALETFYTAAILYNADVVYTSAHYNLTAPDDVYVRKGGINANINTELIINDLNKNLSRLLPENQGGEFHTPWTRFCRRKFLLENKIFFPNISHGGDFIWVVGVYCHARRFLRISTPLYFYRRYNNSITRQLKKPQEQCLYWFSDFENFTRSFLEVERKSEVLKENPIYGLIALRQRFMWYLNRTEEARKEIDSTEFFKVLHSEFTKKISDLSALSLSFLFSFIDGEIKTNEYYSEIANRFQSYFTARIDIKSLSTKVDFQILSISDKKAKVQKPRWLQKSGVGYMIQSCVGELEIVVNPVVDGKIEFGLKGVDIRSSEDNAKRIPYWIDYTKLTVNEETIFDTLKPVWHDKPYNYKMNVKADEEIKIHVEWLPHRADTIELKAETPPPVKVENLIPDSFKPFITARIDTKLMSKEGDFQIVSVSDDEASIQKPRWLQRGGVGYQLESYAGKLDFIAEATADGKIQLKLRGLDVRDPEDDSKHIPYWIDYTKLTVNEETIFDKPTSTWHNKPYNYKMNVKADEKIKIHVEWLPHRADTIELKAETPPPVKVENLIPDSFKPFITARIDTKLMSKEGDFQIVSVSDDKATIEKPRWLQRGGVGYQLESYAGKLDFIAEATADGKIQLKLRGLDVRDPQDKRIPYWIDYTKLIVNDEPIIDKLTPTWLHDSYTYTIDAKAHEEIKIHVEWLPHRSDT
ncbi:MAG: glycosyltransferase [Selenomonadaceae bacterium]|nr:glycosyltransferase [Selenomonadaceae bacterium]